MRYSKLADRSEGAGALPALRAVYLQCAAAAAEPVRAADLCIKIGHALPLPLFARRNAGEFGRTSNQHILSYRAALVEQFIGGSERRKARLSQCYARITFIRARCGFH